MKTVRVIAVFGLLIILALTVAAGGDTDDGASREAVKYKTHDDLLLDIGRRVPEFGGMYLAEDNSVLYVYVLDGAKSSLGIEEVKRAIDDVLKDSPTQRRELRLIPARYSMLQLYEWYAKLQSFVFTNPNVVMTDLDEGRNRIEIGVDSLEETGALEKLLASADIPRKAVVFQVRARPQLAAHSLQDRATGGAMEGGYQITGQGLFACTLGFNVVRGGVAGLVTAGHCTDPTPHDWLGGVDGTEFFQPSSGVNGTAIGEETIDPDFSSDPPLCEAGKVCRYSDAAFIRAAPGLSQNRGNTISY